MTPSVSPLFEPVLWDGDSFKILDETLCPERVEYIRVTDLHAAVSAVREMRTRAFGQVLTFLYSAALLAQRYQGGDESALRGQLGLMTEQFCAARPTFDFKGLASFFPQWFSARPTAAHVGEWIAKQAQDFAQTIVKARYQRAKQTAAILPDPARILTHCNISGELVAIAQFCRQSNKPFSVIATETRPYLQGSRLTAWELSQAGVPVAVIPDCAIAQVMARHEINAVVVGSDRCAQNGDIVNKVGTYSVALTAKRYGIPFYVLVQAAGSLARGADLPIEERPADELLYFGGRPLLPDGGKIAVRYPAFDVTPAALVTKLIAFEGCYTPESFREKFLTGSPAAPPRRDSQGPNYWLVHGVPTEAGYRLLAAAVQDETIHSILVPELRPGLWGARLVAPELARRNVPVTLVSDNMIGTLFAQKQICKLLVFSTGLTFAGPEACCGGLLAAQLACAHGVAIDVRESCNPPEPMLDADAGSFLGVAVVPAGVSIYPLEKETIPWELCGPCKNRVS